MALHGLLTALLVMELALLLGPSSPTAGVREPIELELSLDQEPPEAAAPAIFAPLEPYDAREAFAAAEAVAGRLDFEDPAYQQPLDLDEPVRQRRNAPVADLQEFVQRNLDAAVSQANQQSEEQNLERLEELANQLERTSSTQSIEAVTGVIGNLLGTGNRATRPAAEPVAGAFDTESGQIDDVIRKPLDPEGYTYVAILIDAEGRQIEVELTGPEGKQAFDTFEKIKQYPFLDKIYRGVVMSLLDGAIAR